MLSVCKDDNGAYVSKRCAKNYYAYNKDCCREVDNEYNCVWFILVKEKSNTYVRQVFQRNTSSNWQEDITSAKTIKGSQELLQMYVGIWEKT